MGIMYKLIDGNMVNVYTEDNLPVKRDLLTPNTGLRIEDTVYPFRNKMEDKPGLYRTDVGEDGCDMYIRQDPSENDAEVYDATKDSVDFDNKDSVVDYMKKIDSLRQMERSVLMNVENVFKPVIHENDAKEMKAFKYAVGLKNCDISTYRDRFGSNYNNDKRLFEKDKITMGKMLYLTDLLDMQVDMTFRDKNPDVPNAMGREVRVVLGDDNFDFDEYMKAQQEQSAVEEEEDWGED